MRFAVELLTRLDYGYSVHVPYRTLAHELTKSGYRISFMTVIAYWEALEELGYVTRSMESCVDGVTFNLNPYIFRKLIREWQ